MSYPCPMSIILALDLAYIVTVSIVLVARRRAARGRGLGAELAAAQAA